MNNDLNALIGEGLEVCPSCKSDSWKSAKMIVLEGTTNTQGSISGTVTDPGAFSGGIRELLLSDRWFSWDQEVDLEVGLTTTSGLVEEVKRLMVANSSIVQMPLSPEEPEKIGFFERITPIEPKEPLLVKPELPQDKTWLEHFIESTAIMAVFVVILWIVIGLFASFEDGMVVGISLLVISLPINFLRSFTGNTRAKSQYQEQVKRYPETLEKYNEDCKKYEDDKVAYKLDCDKAELQKNEENNAIALYEKQLSEYEDKKSKVIKLRELLWERAHICMRCGTGYIGQTQ